MAYTFVVADAVAQAIKKFALLNAYQLVGHVGNLPFWQAEVQHALEVIDGYDRRNTARVRAEQQHIGEHDTRTFTAKEWEDHHEFPDDPSEDLIRAAPARSTISKNELKAKRREVADAFYQFIRRAHREGFLSKEASKQALDACGIGMETGDFRD